MFLIDGITAGLIATLVFDIFQISLFYSYNINKTRWNLVGRYFFGLINKKYFYEDLINEKPINNELLFGYFIHYSVGAIFGLIYVILNIIFFGQPSIGLAIFLGFLTVLGSWCIMMPFAFNIGFFGSKKEEQKQLMVQNMIAHFIFGIGLYIGYLI